MDRVMGKYLGICAIAAVLVAWTVAGAAGQTMVNPLGAPEIRTGDREIVLPDRLTPEEVDSLLAALTDAQVRQLLTRQLKESATQQAAKERQGSRSFAIALVMFRNRIIGYTGVLQTRWEQLRKGLAITPGELAKSFDKVTAGRGLDGFLTQLFSLLVILAAGLGTHRLVGRLTGSRLQPPPSEGSAGLASRLAGAAIRALLDLLAIAAFTFVAVGGTALAFGGGASPDKTFVVTYLTAMLFVLGTRVVLRVVLAPHDAALRFVPLTDQTARFLYRWFMLLATVGVFAWLTAGLFILTGMALGAHLIVVMTTGAVMALLLIALIFQSRDAVAELLRGQREDRGEATSGRYLEQFARTWHIFAILYLMVVWFLWSMSMLARDASAVWSAVGSVVVVALLPVIDRLLRALLFRRPAAMGPASEEQPNRYAAVILRVVRAALIVAAGLLVLQLWGFGLFGAGGPESEAAVLEALFAIGITIALAFLVWELTKIAIDRSLLAQEEEDGGGAGAKDSEIMGTNPSTRAQTLLPLIRKFILVVLFVLTTMIVLSSLGVDIGPLLAGAGVIGLAIGFGAQTLVRDVVSGVFFLVDDAFRLGEYVDVGSVKGEVEAINLRSMRLRHHRGAVNTIPFGELHAIVNYSRDWAIYKMEFRLPFDTDIEKVRKIVKKIGLELLEHEEYGPMFLEPLKSQGVLRTDESALIIRTKFTSKPGEQFYIRREAYRRIRDKFRDAGIEFAPRTITVGSAAGGSPAGSGSAAAAAAGAGAALGAAADPTPAA